MEEGENAFNEEGGVDLVTTRTRTRLNIEHVMFNLSA